MILANDSQELKRSMKVARSQARYRVRGALGHCRGPLSAELLFTRPYCWRERLGQSSSVNPSASLGRTLNSEPYELAAPNHGVAPTLLIQSRTEQMGEFTPVTVVCLRVPYYVASWLFPSTAPKVLTGIFPAFFMPKGITFPCMGSYSMEEDVPHPPFLFPVQH